MGVFSDDNAVNRFKKGTEAFDDVTGKSDIPKTQNLGPLEKGLNIPITEDAPHTPLSGSKQVDSGDYIFFDHATKGSDKTGTDFEPISHDKMAYRHTTTSAGSGASFDFKFTDKGKLEASVALSKDKSERGGFSKKGVEFLEDLDDLSEELKSDDDEAMASFADSKLDVYFKHEGRKSARKKYQFEEVRRDAQKDIKTIKKEIKADRKTERKAEKARNRTKSQQESSSDDDKFSSSQHQFTDRSRNFTDVIDEKFHTKEKQEAREALFVDVKKEPVASISVKSDNKVPEFQPSETKTSDSAGNKFSDGRDKKIEARSTMDSYESSDIESKFEQRPMRREERLEQSKAQKKSAKKAENKEMRKAAAKTALSKVFNAKKNMQNQLGDMSGQGTGDLLKDGSTGLLQTFNVAIKEMIAEAAKAIAKKIINFAMPIIGFAIIPICLIFIVINITTGLTSAVGGLLGADSGEVYDLDVNGDGYVYTSLSDEQIDEIIDALAENYDLSAEQEQVLRYSLDKVGCAYNQDFHGNLNVNIFDCSSLAYRAYRSAGIAIDNGGAYSAAEECHGLENSGNTVSGDMLPGDLIFYGGSDNGRYKGIYHVAIYVGRIDGVDKMVEARGEAYGVVYCDVRSTNVVSVGRP